MGTSSGGGAVDARAAAVKPQSCEQDFPTQNVGIPVATRASTWKTAVPVPLPKRKQIFCHCAMTLFQLLRKNACSIRQRAIFCKIENQERQDICRTKAQNFEHRIT